MITSKQLEFLSMNSKKTGMNVFGALTAFDWYVLKNTCYEKETVVIDEDDIEQKVDLSKRDFLVSRMIDFGDKLFSDHILNPDMQCRKYDSPPTRSSEKSDRFNVPVVVSIRKKDLRIESVSYTHLTLPTTPYV